MVTIAGRTRLVAKVDGQQQRGEFDRRCEAGQDTLRQSAGPMAEVEDQERREQDVDLTELGAPIPWVPWPG